MRAVRSASGVPVAVLSGRSAMLCMPSVGTMSGATALTRMPSGPSSTAIVRPNSASAAFIPA